MSILGERLKKVREAYGLTIEDAVKLLGVSRSSIVFYESGTQTPPLEKLCKIADVYMVSVDYLLGRVDYDIDIYQANMERVRREAYECICMRNKKVDYEPEKDPYPNRLAGNKPYPYNLLDAVFEDLASDDKRRELIEWLTEEQEEYLNEALGKLTEREQAVIKYIFEERKTLDEVGKIFGRTRERIREIMHKAVRKLRHPNRSNPIIYGTTKPRVGIYIERIEELGAEIEYLTEQLDGIREEAKVSKEEEKKEKEKVETSILNMPVIELNLSVRTFNALNRAGCKTVGDVVARIENGTIYDIRNFGVRCADELAVMLAAYGIIFARVAKMKGA